MDRDFQTDFVHVFAFNYKAAADHFGVSLRTIYRWFDGNPPPYVKRYMNVMARGWLPHYEPFSNWRIDGTDIYFPTGKVSAFDVEFIEQYKWSQRTLTERFKNRQLNQKEMLEAVEKILEESEQLRLKLRKVI
ncbi:helix-turn-helix domain-containing protein [Idiomarina loihiensis]|uniref:helix-turn-helix domain-containing protein n=1 Tax=Idiomarina loihiensis TaxID=135577 RepID=UPI0039BDCFC0